MKYLNIELLYSFKKNDEKKIELISNQIINFYLFLLILSKRISNRQNKIYIKIIYNENIY